MIEFRELTAEEEAIVESGDPWVAYAYIQRRTIGTGIAVAGTEERARCTVCGGKYRVAGGPCSHIFPAPRSDNPLNYICGLCKREWQPGHTCLVPRPMTREETDLLQAQMADVLAEFRRVQALVEEVLAPENWD